MTGSFFEMLGVQPALGRAFAPEEDHTPGTHPVVIISDHLWRERFASDAGIIRRTIALNGQPFSVIGVAPEHFKGTKFALGTNFWIPMMMQAQIMPQGDRLRARSSLAQHHRKVKARCNA